MHSRLPERSINARRKRGVSLRLVSSLGVLAFAGSCGFGPAGAAPPHADPGEKSSKKPSLASEREVARWAQTEALVEWRVARMAAACNEVTKSTQSAEVRREALRLKAAYATSNYAVLSGRSPLVQALDLAAMSVLNHEVWIEEGRAKAEFGNDANPLIAALEEIRNRTRSHSLTRMSAREIDQVEAMVRAWRRAHPGPVVVEFIRFEAFADEIAASVKGSPDLGGLMGRITGEVRNVEMLGERALFLSSRMPRLAEWHGEAAAANVLAQKDLESALKSVGELGELQRSLPEQVKVLDARLATLPAELVEAVANEPEFKEVLAKLEQADQQVKSIETTVQSLERSVTALSAQLSQLNTATHPDAMRQFSGETLGAISVHGRSLILMATACAAALVLVHAVLRRWASAPR